MCLVIDRVTFRPRVVVKYMTLWVVLVHRGPEGRAMKVWEWRLSKRPMYAPFCMKGLYFLEITDLWSKADLRLLHD